MKQNIRFETFSQLQCNLLLVNSLSIVKAVLALCSYLLLQQQQQKLLLCCKNLELFRKPAWQGYVELIVSNCESCTRHLREFEN